MLKNRVKFIQYKGMDVLAVDAVDASEEESLNIFFEIDDLLAKNPEKLPVLVFANFTNTHYNFALIEKLKSTFKQKKGIFKKYAAMGVGAKVMVFADIFLKITPFDLAFFKTREEALDWLINENS